MAFAPDLSRFFVAQQQCWDRVLAELCEGRKRSHWMWFVFPQIAGLGHSATARHYAIADLAEARAWLRHPLLGARLREAVEALLPWQDSRTAEAIFGGVDAMKLRSSMTLFERAAREEGLDPAPFVAMLEGFHAGERDPATLSRLG